MSQDINPNKSNNPWGKGSRGTVIQVAKTDNELNKTTSLTLESKKDKTMKKTLEKSAKSSRPRNLDADD
jgi:hypothetical protein